jgi:hypothetical protein
MTLFSSKKKLQNSSAAIYKLNSRFLSQGLLNEGILLAGSETEEE